MNDGSRSSLQITQRFVTTHGGSILVKMGEAIVPGADWHMSSHGAAIRVEGEHDSIFERLVVLIPRPTDAEADLFRSWVEERIKQLGWYMEMSNTGTCVQQSFHARHAVCVLMRRIGRSTGDPLFSMPAPSILPGVLDRFVLDLQRYVHHLGDVELRYVRAMKIYQIPRSKREDDFIVGLDVLPTLIGLDRETMAVSPLTLVRGIIGEFAELLDQYREGKVSKLSASPLKWRSQRKEVARIDDVVDGLDEICANIDLRRPSLDVVREWLSTLTGTRPKKKRVSKGSRTVTILLVLFCCALAWHLAR